MSGQREAIIDSIEDNGISSFPYIPRNNRINCRLLEIATMGQPEVDDADGVVHIDLASDPSSRVDIYEYDPDVLASFEWRSVRH
jgi:hypothetical protein